MLSNTKIKASLLSPVNLLRQSVKMVREKVIGITLQPYIAKAFGEMDRLMETHLR
jgi:hypothetical protein